MLFVLKEKACVKNVGSAQLNLTMELLGMPMPEVAPPSKFLAMESIKKMQDKGLDVGPGDFAENLTTEGIDLLSLIVGTKLKIGPEAMVKLPKSGKNATPAVQFIIKRGIV